MRFVTKEKNIKKIEAELGVKLVAEYAGDTVNGYFTQNSKGTTVVLYDKDENPTFEVYEKDGISHSRGRKTTFKKAKIDNTKIKKLAKGVNDII